MKYHLTSEHAMLLNEMFRIFEIQ